jgi:hypothetical protein
MESEHMMGGPTPGVQILGIRMTIVAILVCNLAAARAIDAVFMV